MAIIPNGEQFRSNPEGVDLTNRGNSLVKKNNNVYTMDDIIETVEDSIGSATLPYVKVVFNIRQTGGSSNPELTILENTTGTTLSALRLGVGNYRVLLSSPIAINDNEKAVVLSGPEIYEFSAHDHYHININKSAAPNFDKVSFLVYDANENPADGINRDVELRIYT